MHLYLLLQVKCKHEFGHTYRFSLGCTLKSDKREFKVDVDDDDTEQQLSLKTVRSAPSVHARGTPVPATEMRLEPVF